MRTSLNELQTPPIRMAYLVSRYPAISHTFILREVAALRERNFEICVASINEPDRPLERLTEAERAEAGTTFYLKRAGAVGALVANLDAFLTRPVAYLRGLFEALQLGGWDLRKVLYCLFYFVEALMIGRWMCRLGLRHIHVHFATPASTVALLLTHVFPATMSITVHGPDEFFDVTGYCLRQKIERAAFVCCIGNFARSQLMRLCDRKHWPKFEITPLGVDTTHYLPRPFKEASSPFEVLCVGRLVPAKGQQVLLAAINKLVGENREVRVRIVGDGPDEQCLKSLAASFQLNGRVIFEGAVNQDRIQSLYATADVFALSSFAEGIPVVLMEAMAMEIPCVTTFVAGIPELIRDGTDGILVPPSSHDELAAAIVRLMDDLGARRGVGAAGRQRVLEKYDLNRNVDRLAGVFRDRLRNLV